MEGRLWNVQDWEGFCVCEYGCTPVHMSVKTVTFAIISNILSFGIISHYFSPGISF